MTNLPLLLQFLETAEIPIERTVLPGSFGVSSNYLHHQQILQDWELPKYPGWQIAHIRLVKTIFLLLSALSLTASIVPLFYVKSTTLSLIWCIAPLLIYVPSLLFPEAVVLGKPAYASKVWKKAHISFPMLPFLLPCLLMAILSDMLRVVEKDKQFLLSFLLFLLLLLPYLLCRPSHARKKSTVILFQKVGIRPPLQATLS